MKVLAIGAHPDDAEYYCGGTLLRYKEMGHDTAVCVLTNGDQGHYNLMPEELAATRFEEAKEGCRVLGAELHWMGEHDGFLMDTVETRMALVEVIRKVRPDVVFSHCSMDYHMDHRVASTLAYIACNLAALPHVFTDSPYIEKVPALFYMDGMPGVKLEPTDFVDVTSVWDKKCDALKCHKCQYDWISQHDDVDMTDSMSVICRYRGVACGVRYAEAFQQETAWGRMTTEKLLP